ncbi:MAG: rhodanese-like domain-containing protein [Thermodesulfobacteriota bacterium]
MKFSDLVPHVKTVDADEARKWLEERPEGSYTLVVDVREPAEYEQGHIPGAILIPLSELHDRLSEIDLQKPVLAY